MYTKLLNNKLYDYRNREIKDVIIYGSTVEERLASGLIKQDIQRFKHGKRPKNVKYYLPIEFFEKYYGVHALRSSNINYEGIQFYYTETGENVWFYYYSEKKLETFTRVDPSCLSVGVVNKILSMKGFDELIRFNEGDGFPNCLDKTIIYYNKTRNVFEVMELFYDPNNIKLKHFCLHSIFLDGLLAAEGIKHTPIILSSVCVEDSIQKTQYLLKNSTRNMSFVMNKSVWADLDKHTYIDIYEAIVRCAHIFKTDSGHKKKKQLKNCIKNML